MHGQRGVCRTCGIIGRSDAADFTGFNCGNTGIIAHGKGTQLNLIRETHRTLRRKREHGMEISLSS